MKGPRHDSAVIKPYVKPPREQGLWVQNLVKLPSAEVIPTQGGVSLTFVILTDQGPKREHLKNLPAQPLKFAAIFFVKMVQPVCIQLLVCQAAEVRSHRRTYRSIR